MRVTVTGGNGFIGVNLVELLEKAGHDVAVIDIERSAILDRVGHKGPRHLGADIRSPGLHRLIQGSDAVVHLAALPGVLQSQEDPASSFQVNAVGTLNVLEACRKTLKTDHPTKRFILASSGAAENCCNPYGAGKAAAEALALAYWHSYGLETVSLRFANIYGPWSGRKGSAVGAMIQKVLAGEPLTVDGDGSQTRDFIDVSDVCMAILRAVEARAGDREISGPGGEGLEAVLPGCAGKTFNIGTGRQTNINTLVACIQVAHGGDPIRIVPGRPDVGEQAVPHDVSEARAVLGWQAKTTLEDGVQALYEWFKDRPLIPLYEGDDHATAPVLISAFQVRPGSPLWRIVYRDERGYKKTSEVSRSVCEGEIRRMTAAQSLEDTDIRARSLRECEFLLSHIPEDEDGEARAPRQESEAEEASQPEGVEPQDETTDTTSSLTMEGDNVGIGSDNAADPQEGQQQ